MLIPFPSDAVNISLDAMNYCRIGVVLCGLCFKALINWKINEAAFHNVSMLRQVSVAHKTLAVVVGTLPSFAGRNHRKTRLLWP